MLKGGARKQYERVTCQPGLKKSRQREADRKEQAVTRTYKSKASSGKNSTEESSKTPLMHT